MSLEPIELLSLGLLVSWLVMFYIYWRLMASKATTIFRAYDFLFITVILMLVITRVGGVILAKEMYVASSTVSYLQLWDLNFDYLLLPFIPILAYQFVIFNVEYKKKWQKILPGIFLFGLMIMASVVAVQLARSIYFHWGQDHYILHGGILLVTIVNGILMALASRGRLKIKNITLFVIIESLAIVLLSLSTQVYTEEQLSWIVVSQLVICLLTIAPLSTQNKTFDDAKV